MIADALSFLCQELRLHLNLEASEVIAGNLRNAVERGSHGLVLSVVGVHEETAARNLPNVDGVSDDAESPLHVNVDVLCAFDFPAYEDSLTHLATTIDLFQRKPWFSAATQSTPDAVPFPPTLDSLVLEMLPLDGQELHFLWNRLGTSYLPSVVYRARMVKGT